MDEKRIYGLTFNEVEVQPAIGYMSFGYWNIDPNNYDYEKNKQNMMRDLNREPIEFLDISTPRGKRIGEQFIGSYGSIITCIDYIDSSNAYFDIITKLDNDDIVKYIKKAGFDNQYIKSPYDKSIYGVGYRSVGSYSRSTSEKFYKTFNRMMERSYDKTYKSKYTSYNDVKVAAMWHNLQLFAEWCEENYYEISEERMELDKDIMIKNNKIYAPDRCLFVPRHINTLFRKRRKENNLPIGVIQRSEKYEARIYKNDLRCSLGSYPTPEEAFDAYKEAKEKEIKRVADVYMYEKGGINIPQFHRVHQAMYNYQIEITD